MRIPPDAVIPDEKLTQYLLVRRVKDDKSIFLAQVGFTLDNWENLLTAIRQLTESVEAIEDGSNEYGEFYRIEVSLTGPEGDLSVVLIWLYWYLDETYHFVTLKPQKE